MSVLPSELISGEQRLIVKIKKREKEPQEF